MMKARLCAVSILVAIAPVLAVVKDGERYPHHGNNEAIRDRVLQYACR